MVLEDDPVVEVEDLDWRRCGDGGGGAKVIMLAVVVDVYFA